MKAQFTVATFFVLAVCAGFEATAQPQPAVSHLAVTYQAGPPDAIPDDMEYSDGSGSGVPDGWTLIDGDILMPMSTVQRGCYVTNLWPGGIVPYEFTNVSQEVQDAFLVAMSEWEAAVNVQFVVRTTQPNYVVIQDHAGYPNSSNSAVGCTGGRQVINAGADNGRRVFLHELGHCLGFFHEQSRTDRDQYVYIHMDRISLDACGGFPCWFNFTIESFSSRFGSYDFDSCMHYRQCNFSACDDCDAAPDNCRTISVLPPYTEQWQNELGNDYISYWDQRIMSFLYPETGWRFIRSAGSDLFNGGTFISPWETFTHGLNNTPIGGMLWILDPQTISGSRTLTRAIAIRSARGPVVFQ